MEKQSISMRKVIILTYSILMVITIASICSFLIYNWNSNAEKIINQMENDAERDIFHRIESFISGFLSLNETNKALLENEIVDIYKKDEREKFFVGVVKSNSDDLYSFNVATENGEYYGARKTREFEIEILQNDAETGGHSFYYSVNEELTSNQFLRDNGETDPRTKTWYREAKEKKGPTVSYIYQHYAINDLTISAACPIFDKNGTMKGELVSHISLSGMSGNLKEITMDKPTVAYIVDKHTGELVANSLEMPIFRTIDEQTVKRMEMEDIDNIVIQKAYSQYKEGGGNSFCIDSENGKTHVNISTYAGEGLEWLVITALLENQYTVEILRSIQVAILLSILALVSSIIIYIKFTSAFLRPVYDLIDTSDKFAKGDFTQRAKVFRNDEAGKLSKAFNRLAEKQSTLINTLEKKVQGRTEELEKINAALQERETKIRILLDSAGEAIYGIDTEGKCTFCNAICVRLLGYGHQDELLGRNMHWQIHYKRRDGSSLPVEECRIFQAFFKGEGTHVEDEVFWKADGSCIPVEYYSYPQFQNGKAIGAVITFNDITERMKAQDELISAKEQAEAANIAKSLFLASMSHEIRTPMNGIVGFLEILEKTALNEEQSDLVSTIKASTDTLLAVINDILDISKIEAGKLELEHIPFSVRTAVEATVTSFAANAVEKGLQFKLKIENSIPETVLGDPTKLKQVVGNLVSNAVKFTEKGEVLIKVSADEKMEDKVELTFIIEDTGIGMTEKEINRLFSPFSQTDSSSTRKYGGTGLGLAICKNIAEKMGGVLKVTSKKGIGSIFYFTVPLDITREKNSTPEEKALDITLLKFSSNLKILLVDDNKAGRMVFTKFLKMLGLICDVAKNGREAVEACIRNQYDVVFMDCQMPEMDGYEAAKKIRKAEGEGKHVPIIAITAYAMKGDAEKCLNAGMNAYLTKPVHFDQVVKMLQTYGFVG